MSPVTGIVIAETKDSFRDLIHTGVYGYMIKANDILGCYVKGWIFTE